MIIGKIRSFNDREESSFKEIAYILYSRSHKGVVQEDFVAIVKKIEIVK